jgi:hypothetical protein
MVGYWVYGVQLKADAGLFFLMDFYLLPVATAVLQPFCLGTSLLR